MFDVVCIGSPLVDITVSVPDSFLEGVGLKKGIMSLTDDVSQKFLLSSLQGMNSSLSTGGSSANVALGVAALGGKSSFIGKVGSDGNGSFFESSLLNKGVIPKLSKSLDLMTGSAIALITSDGERTFSTYLGAASSLSKGDVLNLPRAKFFHVEAYLLENPLHKELVFYLVKQAKAQGSKISFDLSDPMLIERIKPVMVDFLEFVDVIFANEVEAKKFTGEDGLNAARSLSNVCEVAVVKLGKNGSVVVSGKCQEIIKPDVVEPVNTNGAGDAYAAGFLFGLANNFDLKKCGAVASFLAREIVLVEEASLSNSLKDKLENF